MLTFTLPNRTICERCLPQSQGRARIWTYKICQVPGVDQECRRALPDQKRHIEGQVEFTARGPYICGMIFPLKLKGDLDNRAKCILDWMVSRELTSDDRYLMGVASGDGATRRMGM